MHSTNLAVIRLKWELHSAAFNLNGLELTLWFPACRHNWWWGSSRDNVHAASLPGTGELAGAVQQFCLIADHTQ
jgi:hypothetical protein